MAKKALLFLQEKMHVEFGPAAMGKAVPSLTDCKGRCRI